MLPFQSQAAAKVGTSSRPRRALRRALAAGCAAAVLLSASCASDVANRYYGAERFEAVAAENVEVLRENPKRPYRVIADFQSRGESVADMQEKAAAIGADAVIVRILGGSYDRREEWAGDDRYKNSYTRIVGTAVKYTAEN